MNSLLVIETEIGPKYLNCQLADRFLSKTKGLLFQPALKPNHGLLLLHCHSIHTHLLKFPIDIVYLDVHFTIIKCISHLKPWRFSICTRACHTLELAAGEISRLHIYPGQICWYSNQNKIKKSQ